MRGHLRRCPERNSWEPSTPCTPHRGETKVTQRPKYLTRTFRGGKRQAQEALARFVTEVSGGEVTARRTPPWVTSYTSGSKWRVRFSYHGQGLRLDPQDLHTPHSRVCPARQTCTAQLDRLYVSSVSKADETAARFGRNCPAGPRHPAASPPAGGAMGMDHE